MGRIPDHTATDGRKYQKIVYKKFLLIMNDLSSFAEFQNTPISDLSLLLSREKEYFLYFYLLLKVLTLSCAVLTVAGIHAAADAECFTSSTLLFLKIRILIP